MVSLRSACERRLDGDRLGGPKEPPGGPPQPPARRDDGNGEGEGRSGALTLTRTRTKKPSMYKVLMLNDDYTPMEFVVHVLERFFQKTREEATRIMLHVHQQGVGCVRRLHLRGRRDQGDAGRWTTPGRTSILCSARSRRNEPDARRSTSFFSRGSSMSMLSRNLEQTLHRAFGARQRTPARICDTGAPAAGPDRRRRRRRRCSAPAASTSTSCAAISTNSSTRTWPAWPPTPAIRSRPPASSASSSAPPIHVQSSGRDEVTGANVLVALFSERESHAVYFLQIQDMTRLDAVNFISHGIAKAPGRAAAPGRVSRQPRARSRSGEAAAKRRQRGARPPTAST